MLSRVADSIYWMARYMERAENLARLLMANQSLMLDTGEGPSAQEAFWKPILMTTGDEEGYAALYPEITGDYVQEFLSVRPENTNSILSCIRGARENARMIRDQITDEVWRAVNDLYLLFTSPKGEQMRVQSISDYYETVMQGSGLFQGVARATMMRNEGWQFLQIGTYLERADQTSRLVDACSSLSLVVPPHPEAKPLRWQALLRSCSAWHGYREHHSEVMPVSAIEFLFLSDRFARSVRFCVREVDMALGRLLAPLGHRSKATNPMRLCGQLRADLDYGLIDEIIAAGLHDYIDDLQSRLNTIGGAIFETYVLYADLTPTTVPKESSLPVPQGAWHSFDDTQVQQQQQQQQ